MSAPAQEIVPLASPGAGNARLKARLMEAFERVLDRGIYILGPAVSAFEQDIARNVGVRGAVGVGSGTDALVIALEGLGVGPDDEVVIPSHTAGPTAAAVRLVGATPVLADVTPDTYAIAPNSVAAALGPRTKAVIAVHLYGCPVDIAGLVKVTQPVGIPLIEDCAQAHGAAIGGRSVGSFGDLGCFSFYPTKNLGAMGDGGAICTSDVAMLARLRALRSYGWTSPQYAEIPGGRCSRLDELQAEMLRIKLDGLGEAVQRRRSIARRYCESFADLPLSLPVEPQGLVHAYHLFVVRTPERNALAAHLKAAGVMTGLHYPYAIHQQPVFAASSRIPRPLTVTEALIPEILSLPLFPELTEAQIGRVISAVHGYFT